MENTKKMSLLRCGPYFMPPINSPRYDLENVSIYITYKYLSTSQKIRKEIISQININIV